ncbi:ubiquitin carboxyl-terminal hydrolase, partial [Musa troglodytarum]
MLTGFPPSALLSETIIEVVFVVTTLLCVLVSWLHSLASSSAAARERPSIFISSSASSTRRGGVGLGAARHGGVGRVRSRPRASERARASILISLLASASQGGGVESGAACERKDWGRSRVTAPGIYASAGGGAPDDGRWCGGRMPPLGFALVALVLGSLLALVARRRWRRAAARRAEVMRLALLAAEEAARAEETLWLGCRSPLPVVGGGGPKLAVCAVCCSPTTTRCSRSRTCQIIHWRQGHKNICCSPLVDHFDGQDGVTRLKELTAERSKICNGSLGTGGTSQEAVIPFSKKLSSESSYSSEAFSDDEFMDSSGTESTSDSSSNSSASSCSMFSVPVGSFVDSSSTSYPSLLHKTGIREHSSSDVSVKKLSTEVDQRASSFASGEVECSPGSNLIGSESCSNIKSSKDDGQCENGTFGPSVSQSTRTVESTEFDVYQEIHHNRSDVAPQFQSSNLSDETIHSQTKSRNEILSSRTSMLGAIDRTSSSASITESERLDSLRSYGVQIVQSKSLMSLSSAIADQVSLVGNSMSNDASRKVENAPKAPMKMYQNAGSHSSDIKTSVQRVVQQLKLSKVSRQQRSSSGYDFSKKIKTLFPYDYFVKLYNFDKVVLRPSGLINCHNSCYANAVLQCLAFTPPLTAYLLQGLHSKTCIYAIDAMQSVCLKEAGAHAVDLWAEETTLIQLTFGGYLQSKIKCMKCHSRSERYERMMDLTVEIEGHVGTLEEALRRFTSTEILDGENKYHCLRCKSYERAKKKLTIVDAPNILTIALKRFQSGKFGKLNKAVRFPEYLDLAPYMHGSNDKSPMYKLYAVVVHLDVMNASFSGHYVCYVKNRQGKWYKTDDSTVKSVELETVLSKNAYMLLYARCSPHPPSLISSTLSPDQIVSKRSRSKELFCSGSDREKASSNAVTAMSDLPSAHHRSQAEPNWTPGYRFSYEPNNFLNDIFCVPKLDSSSDSSSLISCSDEASCSTESTRNSTSTDEYSEYIFGDFDRQSWNGSLRFSNDLDGSLSTSLYSNHSSEAASYKADGVVDDRVWDLQDGGSPILFSDTTNQCRKLTECNRSRETGWVTPSKLKPNTEPIETRASSDHSGCTSLHFSASPAALGRICGDSDSSQNSVALTAEGRPPKEDDKTRTRMCYRCLTQVDASGEGKVEGTIAPSAEKGNSPGLLVGGEDVRPTNPGHSPGVGHSIGNKGVDKN